MASVNSADCGQGEMQNYADFNQDENNLESADIKDETEATKNRDLSDEINATKDDLMVADKDGHTDCACGYSPMSLGDGSGCDNVLFNSNQNGREKGLLKKIELNGNICDNECVCVEETTSNLERERFMLNPKHVRPDEIPLKQCLGENDVDYESLFLERIPPEIFLKICSFLHAKFVIGTLTRVCRKFYDLLMDDATWKIRVAKRCSKKKYPAVPVKNFNWKRACIEWEEQHRLWSDPDNTMDHFMLSDGISAPVDAVHLMNNGTLLASGSRDKYLNLWDINRLDASNSSSKKDARIVSKMNAHKGWIWAISSYNNVMATASWDTYLKFWDLGGGFTEIRSVKFKSAVLATQYNRDVLIAGSYDKYVSVVDPRVATIVSRMRHHRRPVLCVAGDDNYIISGSEDGTVCVYDRRAEILLKTLHFDHFPMCMDYKMNQLYIGDKMGRLHLVDATDLQFDLIKTYDTAHNGKLSGVLYNYGSIITCSTDRTVRIMEPCFNPSNIHTIKAHDAEISRISWQNDVLATAGCDMTVGVWRPKQEFPMTYTLEDEELIDT